METTQASQESGSPFVTPIESFPDNLKSLADQVSARHTGGNAETVKPKNKGGRPRLPRDEAGKPIRSVDGQSQVSSVPSQPSVAPVAPPIDLKLVEDCFRSVLVTIDETVKASFGETVYRLTQSKPMAENIVNKVALKNAEKEMMPKLAALCCQQYGLAGQHAPIVFLGCFTVGYVARGLFVSRELRSIARLIADKKKEKVNGESLTQAE